MFGLRDDPERAREIGRRVRDRRERDRLTLADVARATGVSAGTIKRFEEFAVDENTMRSFRYEPWGAEYLERWLDDTLTPDVITKHDLQRVLQRDPGLTRKQVERILAEFLAIYDRVRSETSSRSTGSD